MKGRKLDIPVTEKATVKQICDITTQVCGLPENSLRLKTRQQKYQIPRMVASNIARVEREIHYTSIADVLDRDRSSIYHYEKSHKVLYQTWSVYRDMFNSVYNAYNENKKTQLSEKQLRKILNDIGIQNNPKPKVFIKVKVVDVMVTVKSDYTDFCYIVEQIKLALKDFNHELYIEVI